MSLIKFKTALVSVSDKTGLVDFLKPLAKDGLKVISTGGTAKHLRENGINTIDVSEVTGFPEVMDGRVKTLHPNIHMSLLAREEVAEDLDLLKKNNLNKIDLVIVNLYPFEAALKAGASEHEQIEQIDIGGPSLLRAACKNFSRITVVCDPSDYPSLDSGSSESVLRKKLAAKAFSHVSSYDAMIADYLGREFDFKEHSLGGALLQSLRYGENPQQQAAWFRQRGASNGIHQAKILQGKELSYNNLLDLDAAYLTLMEFKQAACVAVKHNNPCGVAVAKDLTTAVRTSLQSDPVSVFGGIIAVNKEIDEPAAELLAPIFLECILAPGFSSGARKIFEAKKNLRLLEWPQMLSMRKTNSIKTISGGYLVQTADQVEDWPSTWQVRGQTPADNIKADLSLAWRVVAHLKSNAISIAGQGFTLGLGMGQVNRVDAVEIAIQRWKRFHPQIKEVVLASDAFFPFPDSIEKAAQAGIYWIIQPGGSVKDPEVFQKAKELGVNLVITGRRHFLH